MTSSTQLPWHSETKSGVTTIYDFNKKQVAIVHDPRDADEIVRQMNNIQVGYKKVTGTDRPHAA